MGLVVEIRALILMSCLSMWITW